MLLLELHLRNILREIHVCHSVSHVWITLREMFLDFMFRGNFTDLFLVDLDQRDGPVAAAGSQHEGVHATPGDIINFFLEHMLHHQ